jgi:hypothetical protein
VVRRSRVSLRQCGVVRAVASNGWSRSEAFLRTSETGAYAVLGPIIGKVTPTSVVVLIEADMRARLRCVLTDSFTGKRYVCSIGRARVASCIELLRCISAWIQYRVSARSGRASAVCVSG